MKQTGVRGQILGGLLLSFAGFYEVWRRFHQTLT
jgi:hypothetical protein